MAENQYPETVRRLAPQIERTKVQLRAGTVPSELANSLHAEGLGDIELLVVFLEATGASLGDLKAFGQWWSPEGVTNREAFDRWASAVLLKERAIR